MTVGPLHQIDVDHGALAPLQALLERCADFIALVEGRPVEPGAAADLVDAVPPGRDRAAKRVVGYYLDRPDALVGVADVILDHPEANDRWIGLLLIDPAWRGCGLGERAAGELHAWFRRDGARASWLCVQEQNPGARRFWDRLGYEIVDERIQRLGDRDNRVFRMRKTL